MHYCAVGAFFRHERYIPEWIEYHRLIGIDHFYLVCNDDNPHHSWTILDRYAECVTRCHLSGSAARERQMDAYQWILSQSIGKSRWVAFIDLDEFLVPLKDSLNNVLKDYEQFPALAVNRVDYGSSNLFFPPILQIEGYLYRAVSDNDKNRTIKSIVNPESVKNTVNSHSFLFKEGYLVDEFNQQLLPGTCFNYNNLYFGKRLRINHYRIRSWVDFLDKVRRWKRRGHPQLDTYKNIERYWFKNDLNDIYDDSALRFLPGLRKKLVIQSEADVFTCNDCIGAKE